jgi:hypothetical protein
LRANYFRGLSGRAFNKESDLWPGRPDLDEAKFWLQGTSMWWRLSALGLFFLVRVQAKAELPPWVYKERQDKAPEALVIKVRSVKGRETKQPNAKVTEFTVEAEVEKVERSATKLTPGVLIKIVYSRTEYSQPIAGPSEPSTLREGQVCPAFLSREGEIYVPAAGGYSFDTVR